MLPSAKLFFTSLSLPMLFGAYGGVDAVMLGFAISSFLNGERRVVFSQPCHIAVQR